MKKYVLFVLLICIGIQAEDNPFELKENLQKIDKDQEVLLSALKEISDVQKIGEDVAQMQSKEVVQQKKSELKFKKMKEMQEKIEGQKKLNLVVKKEVQVQEEKALAKKKQEEFQRQEKERLEVEAYEKKRAHKKKHMNKEIVMASKGTIMDINITREQILSKKEADKAYLEAIAEMDKED